MAFQLPAARAIAAGLALATLAACSGSDSQPPAPSEGMGWTANGSATTANSYQPNVAGTDVILTGSAISGTAFSSVTLTLPLQVGTYNLTTVGSDVKAVYVAGTDNTSGTAYYATSGTATVTSVTATKFVGTFSFSGTDATGAAFKTIGSGKFNVTL